MINLPIDVEACGLVAEVGRFVMRSREDGILTGKFESLGAKVERQNVLFVAR